MSAGHRDDDLFDAMLGVALREGAAREGIPCESAPRTGPSGPAGFEDADRAHHEGATRPHATWRECMPLLLAAAGLLICGAVWWLLRFPPGDDPVDLPADRSATESGDLQDPVEISEWIERLADPSQRSQAIAALVAAGEKGADAVAEAIAAAPARDGEAPHPRFMGLLAAAARFGPRTDRFLEPLRDRVDDFQTDQMVDVLAVFTHAALFHDVDHPAKKISAARLEAFGRRWEGGGVEAANRCILDSIRQRENRDARTWAEKGMLGDLLTGPEPGVRLAALERMAGEPAWDPRWTSEVEGALRSRHPKVARPSWADAQQVQNREVDLTPEIHAAAARLLLERFAGDARSALGHAWVLGHADDAAARRRAAMALGPLLADTADGPRVDGAVAALTAAAEGPELDVARDAVTSLGMLEGAARSALPLLERLSESSDGGLAARAKAAAERVRGSAQEQEPRAPTRLIEDLADPDLRAAAITALVAQGAKGAELVELGLRRSPTTRGGKPDPMFTGLLEAARAFGPHTARFLDPIQQRAAQMDVHQAIAAYGVFARAALWEDIANPHGTSGVHSLQAFGQEWADPGLDGANRIQQFHVEFLGAKAVREAFEGVDDQADAAKWTDSGALVRLAALARLAWESEWNPAWTEPLTRMLVEDQPPLVEGWWKNPLTLDNRRTDVTEAIRDRAAALILRHATDATASVLAHGWIVGHGAGSEARCASAQALGQLLADPADRNPARVENALAALQAAAEGDDLALAREAVTSLGMLGQAAASASALLERLETHPDRGLAERARAALVQIRR